ncbi:MAG: hypothetical protein ACPLRO_06660 [Candidatus Kapaibacteriota bacterium]
MKKRSSIEKLVDSKDLPKFVGLKEELALRWGGRTMVVPSPLDVFYLMAQVPKSRVTSIGEIRKAIARKYNADIACPLTTEIFATISAQASEENTELDHLPKIPFWRTLKGDGE